MTDAWLSPNHQAFVAFLVHLEHNGTPLTFPLDVVEVAKVQKTFTVEALVLNVLQSHTGTSLASAFAKVLEEFGVTEKVSSLIHSDVMTHQVLDIVYHL